MTVLRLDAPAKLQVKPLDRVRGPHAFPLASGIAIAREHLLARFLQTPHRAGTALAPLPPEGRVGAASHRAVLGEDDGMIVRAQFLVQALGRGGEEVA